MLGSILVLSALLQAGAAATPKSDVELLADLCNGKRVELTKATQLASFASHLPSSGCSPSVKRAIGDLSHLVQFSSGNVCNTEKAQLIKDFYGKYINTTSWLSSHLSSGEQKLPKDLKRFALAYGMQVSNVCKKNMVQTLTSGGERLPKREDFAKLGDWIADEGPVAELLDAISVPDMFVLPGNLRKMVSGKNRPSTEKIYLQSHVTYDILRLQSLCERRFKPVYSPLMDPLTLLTGCGFNYRDTDLKSTLKDEKVSSTVAEWSRIVFVCEALFMVNPVPFPPVIDWSRDMDREYYPEGMVRVLTEKDAQAEMRKLKLFENTYLEEPNEVLSIDQVERLEFTPIFKLSTRDLVVDKTDKNLMSKVKGFKTYMSEEQRAKKQFVYYGLQTMGRWLVQGEVKMVFTDNFLATLRKIKKTKGNEELATLQTNLAQAVQVLGDKRFESIASDITIASRALILFTAVLCAVLFGFLFGAIISAAISG